jgi:hypothetical protein
MDLEQMVREAVGEVVEIGEVERQLRGHRTEPYSASSATRHSHRRRFDRCVGSRVLPAIRQPIW